MLKNRLSKLDGCNWLTIYTHNSYIFLAGYQGKVFVDGFRFTAKRREELLQWVEGRFEFVGWREMKYEETNITQEAAVYATPDYIAKQEEGES